MSALALQPPVSLNGQAPRHILERERTADSFKATVTKRFGKISANDFLLFAGRLYAVCNTVYRGTNAILEVDSKYLGQHEEPTTFDFHNLSEDEFRQQFEEAESCVCLRLSPTDGEVGLEQSYANLEWDVSSPRDLVVWASDGATSSRLRKRRKLEPFLRQKMFYVPNSAPNFQFDVMFGLRT